METKRFRSEVIASLTTGILMCDFGDMHEAAEWIAGHSIWTHEFALDSIGDAIKARIYAEHPQFDGYLVHTFYADQVPVVSRIRERFGKWIVMPKGDGKRSASPLETLRQVAPNKPVIAVVTDPAATT